VRVRRWRVRDDPEDSPWGDFSSYPGVDSAPAEHFAARTGKAPFWTFADITRGGSFAITPSSKVRRFCSLCLATAFLALLPGVYTLPAQVAPSVPRFTFTKTLKGSSPEYMALRIDANGKGTYDSRKLEDPPAPRPLQISAGTTAQIFSLAESLNYFRSLDLDSHHKVANMGLKTLTYEAGKEINQVQYNYTENRAAQQLTDMLEKIGNVEERIAQLEYAMKYDHLSLPEALRQIQEGLDDHNFVEAALMIPTLEKISTNPHFMHLAQSRAHEIVQRIQENK
jgi:hypothetical protein